MHPDLRQLFSSFVALLLLWGCGQKVRTRKVDPTVQARIERIENNLYPIYNLRGQEKPRTVQEMMRENKIAGLSIAFVDQGKISWTRCYGYADLKDSIKMTPDHVLRAASLSKPLTAMAALHLVEEGKLEFHQDINQKLQGWKLPENEFTKDRKVTVAQIIGHRSGIKNEIHDITPANEKLPSLEDIFSGKTKYAATQVVSIPGEKYKYSNVGYMVLSELLTDITGKDFPALMNEVVLKPCGMKSSTFDQELPTSFRSRIATAYNGNLQSIPYYKHTASGAGGLWTTPGDLGLFLAEILSAYHDTDRTGKIISHEMAKKVFEASRDKLGFNKYVENGNFVFRNDGSIAGYNCILMGSLTKNQAVVLMLNTGSDEAYGFLNYLWRSVSMEYGWGVFEPSFFNVAEVPVEKLKRYEGHYANQKDSIRITFENDRLEVHSDEAGKKQLVPIGNTSFIIPDIPMRFDFEMDSLGAVKNLYVRDAGGNLRSTYFRMLKEQEQ